MFMEGLGTPETRAAYLTAMGVEFAAVPTGLRPPITDPRTGAPAEWEVAVRLDGVDVLRLPWTAPYAAVVPNQMAAGIVAPDLPFTNVEQSYIRDEVTRRWAALLTGADAIPATATALGPDRLTFVIPSAARGTLLVSENWDTTWTATAGHQRLPIHRAGPNLLAIDLNGATPGADGRFGITLVHGTPPAWRWGALVMLLTMPLTALAVWRGPRIVVA
jgi:hypothetical protein